MSKNLGSRIACWVLAAVAAVVLFAPTAEATPITYNFTVNVTKGPLTGNSYNGSFSYDSSSIVPGGSNTASGLLTSLNFTFDGTNFNANTANAGALSFDSNGNLNSFTIGTDCVGFSCQVAWGQLGWAASPGFFIYSIPGFNGAGINESPDSMTFSLATVHVPEPGSLGIFCFGVLLLLAASALNRRWTYKQIEN